MKEIFRNATAALPRATMRLQLHKDFPFAAAQAQVPYFAALGISHLYLSPILTARSGSPHGYDVVDHAHVNPELGGEDAYRELVAELRRHGMGVIVDIVPNHMAIGGADNRLWLDVLEWGHRSRYANFFDIDWKVPDPVLGNRILAPFLGSAYGDALANGDLRLCFDGARGRFHVAYYEHRFPIAPATYPQLLRVGGGVLAPWAKRFRDVIGEQIRQRGESFDTCCRDLATAQENDGEIRAAIDALLMRFDSTGDSGRALLHQLLERQHYRLSLWRNAADEINWRRFFDVIHLIGIRIEETAAFEIVHGTIFRLYAEGLIDGVRVDHIDGLADPKSYCRRLRARLNRLARLRPPDAPKGRAYFIVEKILAPEERLPREWQVDGTTGYSFMNDVSALLHDPHGEPELNALWVSVSGRSGDFAVETQSARRRILRDLLGAEFNSCALALHRIARSDLRTRDWSLLAVRRVLNELLVQFPIYRTYADACGRSAADSEVMRQAIAAARPHCRSADRPLLDLFDAWLGGQPPRDAPARMRTARLRAIARFQQLSSPLAAKSVEDTAFYRHGQLLSRNEVGSDPAQFANDPRDFHSECVRRARYFPRAMLATATHDHKRGEDVRARLAILSEIPARWAMMVRRWLDLNGGCRIDAGENFFGAGKFSSDYGAMWPIGADEYMLYQTMVGCWPLELRPDDRAGLHAWNERLWQWWLKALREAKQLSSWGEPHERYEAACRQFLNCLLDAERSADFLRELYDFVESIAAPAALNGLSQCLIKLAAPGIPDIYQGREFWDFSLVDPDNRRPVDYAARSAALARDDAIAMLLRDWRSGAVKQRLIARLLQTRARLPDLFLSGSYEPVAATGPLAGHVFAFARICNGNVLLIAVPLFPARLRLREGLLPDPSRWQDTALTLANIPDIATAPRVEWFDIVAQTAFFSARNTLRCADLFDEQPFRALLLRNH